MQPLKALLDLSRGREMILRWVRRTSLITWLKDTLYDTNWDLKHRSFIWRRVCFGVGFSVELFVAQFTCCLKTSRKWQFYPGVLATVQRGGVRGSRQTNSWPSKTDTSTQVTQGQVSSLPWWWRLFQVSPFPWSSVLKVPCLRHCGVAWWGPQKTQDQLAFIFPRKVRHCQHFIHRVINL